MENEYNEIWTHEVTAFKAKYCYRQMGFQR